MNENERLNLNEIFWLGVSVASLAGAIHKLSSRPASAFECNDLQEIEQLAALAAREARQFGPAIEDAAERAGDISKIDSWRLCQLERLGVAMAVFTDAIATLSDLDSADDVDDIDLREIRRRARNVISMGEAVLKIAEDDGAPLFGGEPLPEEASVAARYRAARARFDAKVAPSWTLFRESVYDLEPLKLYRRVAAIVSEISVLPEHELETPSSILLKAEAMTWIVSKTATGSSGFKDPPTTAERLARQVTTFVAGSAGKGLIGAATAGAAADQSAAAAFAGVTAPELHDVAGRFDEALSALPWELRDPAYHRRRVVDAAAKECNDLFRAACAIVDEISLLPSTHSSVVLKARAFSWMMKTPAPGASDFDEPTSTDMRLARQVTKFVSRGHVPRSLSTMAQDGARPADGGARDG